MEASFIIESSLEDSAACLPLPSLHGEPTTPLSQSVSVCPLPLLSAISERLSYTNTTLQPPPLILSQGLYDSNPSWTHLPILNSLQTCLFWCKAEREKSLYKHCIRKFRVHCLSQHDSVITGLWIMCKVTWPSDSCTVQDVLWEKYPVEFRHGHTYINVAVVNLCQSGLCEQTNKTFANLQCGSGWSSTWSTFDPQHLLAFAYVWTCPWIAFTFLFLESKATQDGFLLLV